MNLLPSAPPRNPEDILGIIESVYSIWLNADKLTQTIESDSLSTGASQDTLDSFELDDNAVYHIRTIALGVTSSSRASHEIAGTFYRDGGTATQSGSTTTIHDSGTWAVVFDVNGNDVRVRVTGEAIWRSTSRITKLTG